MAFEATRSTFRQLPAVFLIDRIDVPFVKESRTAICGSISQQEKPEGLMPFRLFCIDWEGASLQTRGWIY